MKTTVLAILAVALAGCATTTDVGRPRAATLAAARDACEQEAQAGVYLYASPDLSRPHETRDDPWTVARDWPRTQIPQRLHERDIFESCMAQQGYPGAGR